METRIQAYFRAAAGRRRDTVRVGPFLAAFDEHSDNPFRNYAIPDDGATPSPEDVQVLSAAFIRRDRLPRLEYIASAAPAAEAVLRAGGFAVEGRLTLMTVAPDAARELPVPPGVELLLAAGAADLHAAATVQNTAYGEPTTTEHDVARLRATVAAGGCVVLARDAASGEPIGAGLYAAPHAGATEIAAIGTLPAYRRRGVAGAVCSRLLREALAAGATTPFLMAEHESEARIYSRIGFVATGEILLLTRPRDVATEGQ